jgi:hypothetical protein
LRKDNLVTVDRHHVEILDFDALSLASDFENSYLGGAVRGRVTSVESMISETLIPQVQE